MGFIWMEMEVKDTETKADIWQEGQHDRWGEEVDLGDSGIST